MKKLVGIAVVGVLIGGVLGYVLGSSSAGEPAQGPNVASLACAAKLEKAKKLFPAALEMRMFSATVKEVRGTSVVVELPASSNPFDEYPTTREVAVGASTTIVRQEMKSPAEFQKEVSAYQRKLTELPGTGKPGGMPTLPMPPVQFTEAPATLSELEPGDQVFVEADHDIKTEETFTAVLIRVQGRAGGALPPLLPLP